MATDTTQAAGVTAELDNFVAAAEFSAPHFENDTCGEDAFRVIQHAKSGASLTGDTMFNVRSDMAAKGYRVQGGTVMSDLVDYFSKYQALDVSYANGYGSSWDAIHQTLLAHAGRDGIVIEVEIASNLTGNERGVGRHYVAIGGIHPVKGYLVANGDDVLALAANHGHGTTYPCRWMDQNVLAAAKPSACAVIRGLSYTTDLSAGAVAAPQLVVGTDGLIVEGSAAATGTQEQASEPGEVGEVSAPSEPTPAESTHGELHGYALAGSITTIP